MTAVSRSTGDVGAATRFVERELIASTLRNVWPSMPALSVASAAVCLAAVVPVLVAPGVTPLAAVAAAIFIAPFGAALVAVVQQMACNDHGTLRTWSWALRTRWRFAIGQALVAAAPTALFLTALHVLDTTGAVWVWPSVAVSGAAAAVTILGLMAAVPLGLADPALRRLRLWLAAVALVATRPVRFLAVAATLGVLVWLGTALSASLLLFVPAPAAIVAVTATWTSAAVATSSDSPHSPTGHSPTGHSPTGHSLTGRS